MAAWPDCGVSPPVLLESLDRALSGAQDEHLAGPGGHRSIAGPGGAPRGPGWDSRRVRDRRLLVPDLSAGPGTGDTGEMVPSETGGDSYGL